MVWSLTGAPGITPAYAGKSCRRLERRSGKEDHPRMCGEKQIKGFKHDGHMGSPPHVRGKGELSRAGASTSKITPAYAGKRPRNRNRGLSFEDHPRVCGEKEVWAYFFGGCFGSPPRMRGKDSPENKEISGRGITPAYAGKRLKRSRSTVPPVAIVPLFPSVCNKPVVSDGSPAGRDAPLFLPAENAVPASPAYNLRSL